MIRVVVAACLVLNNQTGVGSFQAVVVFVEDTTLVECVCCVVIESSRTAYRSLIFMNLYGCFFFLPKPNKWRIDVPYRQL